MADGSDGLPMPAANPSVSWTPSQPVPCYLDDAAANTVLVMSTNGGATFSLVMHSPAQDQPKVATGANSVWIVSHKSQLLSHCGQLDNVPRLLAGKPMLFAISSSRLLLL